ncbi:uncharacterized protein LOC122064763 [Macadamia integrifolia]|uniref:uncharacterized protein LOC122064763 n=1 Tax=Macadamia integrifolia TaxID=60698 RepID=UPI001C500B19|nr:uncharacterized protein LOC122064763 [Macadamia integrifolia]
MSGGVGPTVSDIRLTKEEEAAEGKGHLKSQKQSTRRGFLSFRQLNALAIIVVFSASGMVGIADLAFTVLSLIYVFFLSKVAFPLLGSSPDPPVFGQSNKTLNLYVSFAAVIGLFLPIAYIFEGILEGDKEGIKAAAPHVFLLASQVFMEGLTFSAGLSLPIRAFVPVFYNSMRIFTLFDWLKSEIEKVGEGSGGSVRRVYFGRALAVANLGFWCFNLFGFLLPVYLPLALKKYYGYKEKI